MEQYGPGQRWHNNGKAVRTEYLTNTESGVLACKWYRTTNERDVNSISIGSQAIALSSGGKELSSGGFVLTTRTSQCYPPNQLYVTKLIDEDGNDSYEFKDKQGQVLLTRQMEGTIPHDTYYIYDDWGNLRAVLPSLAADLVRIVTNQDEENKALADYAYLYKYDYRNRCIEKKLPGCEPIKYRYDKADRLIFSQDGEQAARKLNEWTFYLYDSFNREVVRGECRNPEDISNKVITASIAYNQSSIGDTGYWINTGSLSSMVIHQVNYYDNYTFRTRAGFNNSHFPEETYSGKGMLTASVTTVLDSQTKLYSANYYNERGELVSTVSSNHLGGYEKTTTTYTFTGKPDTVQHVHTASGKDTQTQLYTYTYDHADRLKTVTHKLNTGSTVTLVDNTYDELGRLQKKCRNGVSTLADDYTYNVRSWITKIQGFHAIYNLSYQYNGNIDTLCWQSNSEKRKYMYEYDGLSRLKKAGYIGTSTAEKYSASYSYDKHGNINALERYGKTDNGYGVVDNLRMTYAGNQLTKVNDTGTIVNLSESNAFEQGVTASIQYKYNKNGAMIQDLNRRITNISYNSISLPLQVDIDGKAHRYMYTADGCKLQVKQSDFTRDYVGNLVYEDGSLKKILVKGAYIERDGSEWRYYFNLNDPPGKQQYCGQSKWRDSTTKFILPVWASNGGNLKCGTRCSTL